MSAGSNVLLIIVAILFPPAAAAFLTGCSCDLLINVLLTILGYIPGHVHAFWLIYKKMKAEERFGPGGYRCASLEGHTVVGASAPVVPPAYGATTTGY